MDMKAQINKFLMLVICTSALMMAVPVRSGAQTVSQIEEKLLPVSEFSSLSVSDDFEVTLVKGAYNVRLTTDKVLVPYVQVYVRSKVLYITYDEKAVPKDLKKQYKGKNASAPVFRAVVSLPELNGLELKDNASLSASEEFNGNSFTLNLQDKAQVKNLKMNVLTAQLNLKKNSSADLDLFAEQSAEIATEGNTTLKIRVDTPDLNISAANSATITLNGTSSNLEISTSGSSKIMANETNSTATMKLSGSSEVTITGGCDTLLLNTDKSATLDGSNYVSRMTEALMNGGKANVHVNEELSVAISGGSALYYNGMPVFKISKVVKSTLAPYGTGK